MKTCTKCKNTFEISEKERELWNKICNNLSSQTIPPFPDAKLCPLCRYQKRLSYRNEWTLYQRKCDSTDKKIVSIYSQDKPFPVYSPQAWWSDSWDPLDYGREFDFSRPFFEQFHELQMQVPRLAITNSKSENSEFTNQGQYNKNCYLTVASNNNENCYYGNWCMKSKFCMDCYAVEESELCYECVNGTRLYRCFWCFNLEACHEAYFSSDCKSCSQIFGCHGLRHKNYYIFNQPVSKEEWETKISPLISTIETIKKVQEQSNKIRLQVPQKYYLGKNNEDFSGDWLQNCKTTYDSFNCRHCWDIINCQDVWEAKDCTDLTETLGNESARELEGSLANFSFANSKTFYCSNVIYGDLCHSSRNVFGCVGLKRGNFCVLNKQYSREEYEKLLPKIIEHLVKTGEWGNFFPIKNSIFAYNETVAQEYFPLTKAKALEQGLQWKDDLPHATGKENIALSEIPADINSVPQNIVEKVLTCEACSKNYKIIPQELDFYKQLELPIPHKCSDCRRANRYKYRNPRKLWSRNCSKCGTALKTTYNPESPERIVCEDCYLNEIG